MLRQRFEIVKQKNETIRVKELLEEQARDFAEKSKPKIQVVYEKVMKKRGKKNESKSTAGRKRTFSFE